MRVALVGDVSCSYDMSLGQSSWKIGGEPAAIPNLPTGADNKRRNAEDRMGVAIGGTSLEDRLSVLKPFEPKLLT